MHAHMMLTFSWEFDSKWYIAQEAEWLRSRVFQAVKGLTLCKLRSRQQPSPDEKFVCLHKNLRCKKSEFLRVDATEKIMQFPFTRLQDFVEYANDTRCLLKHCNYPTTTNNTTTTI